LGQSHVALERPSNGIWLVEKLNHSADTEAELSTVALFTGSALLRCLDTLSVLPRQAFAVRQLLFACVCLGVPKLLECAFISELSYALLLSVRQRTCDFQNVSFAIAMAV
jgi:hypothetical protein